jgi:hypothetical protein
MSWRAAARALAAKQGARFAKRQRPLRDMRGQAILLLFGSVALVVGLVVLPLPLLCATRTASSDATQTVGDKPRRPLPGFGSCSP